MKNFTVQRRREDDRLLRGRGNFVDDKSVDHQCVGYVLRSQYAHARIRAIDIAAALDLPGVLSVLTIEDLRREAIGTLPCASTLINTDGSNMTKPPRPLLASERVRYVGEPVAFIVAEHLDTALQAGEMIEVDYDELPVALDCDESHEIWACAPNNVCFDWSSGQVDAVSEALSKAAHVVSIDAIHPRMAIVPLEPRAALGEFDPVTGKYTLYAQTQGVHSVRRVLAQDVLHIPLENLRVVTQDVGGSFGMKIFTYPEYALVLIAARKLLRPVKWCASRSESFLSDTQGRARRDHAQLGLNENAQIVALRIDSKADLGAYLSYVGPSVPTQYGNMVTGHTYKIPSIYYRCRGYFTNAVPTDAYRGAGKPETVCTVEQLLDKAAFELNIDRIELRRKNFVQPDDLPYTMPNGHVIDSGNFQALLDTALERANWKDFAHRRCLSEEFGKIRGIGLGMYMHTTSVSTGEVCELRFRSDGSAVLFTGSQSAGQGHATALAEIAAEALQIDANLVHVVQGDTNEFEIGAGTGGSQLLAISGNTVTRTAAKWLAQLRSIAAQLLEVSHQDIDYERGRFFIPGTDRKIGLAKIAERVFDMSDTVANESACVARVNFEGTPATHPCGAYVAELECDPQTGVVRIISLFAVDDLGKVLFPQLADGQLHGSWAQSVGTALMESVEFADATPGQPISASLMDYQLPRAQDMPLVELEKLPTLCKTNALGVKGAGEVASLGAPGAILNALSDMLSKDSFVTFDKPATPLRVWQKIHQQQHCER